MQFLFFISIFAIDLYAGPPEPLTTEETQQLVSCYQKDIGSQKSGEEKFRTALRHYPIKHLYKLFIDKDRLANPSPEEKGVPPQLLFDLKEPGYYQSMLNAFEYLPKTIGSPVTLELLTQLHDRAVGGVVRMKKGIHPGLYAYKLPPTLKEHKTDKALNELFISKVLFCSHRALMSLSEQPRCLTLAPELPRFLPSSMRDECALYLSSLVDLTITSSVRTDSHLESLLKKYIDYYHTSISKLGNLEDKLAAIAELIRTLEVAHFFPDGNQRTYAFLLLNKLLIDNNLPPAILDHPSMFDGWMTLDQMVKEIQVGISNFLNENIDQHRLYLSESCQSTDSSSLGVGKYVPFFETIQSQPIKAAEILKNRVMTAIGTKSPNSFIPGVSPLHDAIWLGSSDSIEQLLELGANPFGSSFFTSAFYLTYMLGNLSTAHQLLSQGKKESMNERFIQQSLTHWLMFSRRLTEGDSQAILLWSNIMETLLQSLQNVFLKDDVLAISFREMLSGSHLADSVRKKIEHWMVQYKIGLDPFRK